MAQNKEPRNNPCLYDHLIYDKEARIYNVEMAVSSISVGKTGLEAF